MAYEYKIGTTQVGMVLLSSLGIPAPKSNFVPHSVEIELGNGELKGQGWPTDEWRWGFLTSTQRDALRTYIPGRSATIFVRDLKDDGTTWEDFRVVAVWPKGEDRQAGRRLDFTIELRAMEEL